MSGKYPITRNVTKIKYKDKDKDKGKNKFKYLFKYKWKNGKDLLISDKKTVDRINKLRIPPAYLQVKIFPSTSKIQYTALDDRNRIQKGYHPIWIQERNRKKFRDLIEFVKIYPKIIRKINKILPSSSVPKTKEQFVALATGVLDACRIRPGSDKHLRDTGSYGTTTLCKKHIKKKNGKIALKFVGKSGVTNECVLKTNTKVAKNLYNLAKQRNKADSYIFNVKDFKVTGNDINNFLQDIGGENISGKSFRTYHANLAFLQKILPSIKGNSLNTIYNTESKRKKHIVEIIKKAASEMHHNPATFNNSYLFTPMKDLYITDPDQFKRTFNKKDLNKAFAAFIKKNTLKYAEVPKNW